jgi:hypothetical protein
MPTLLVSAYMSVNLHSFDCHVSSIACSPTGDTAYALSHVFGNEWTGQVTITRAPGGVLTLPQHHGVTCVTWLERGRAVVFGNEEGDLCCTRSLNDAEEQLEITATTSDFDGPIAGEQRCM